MSEVNDGIFARLSPRERVLVLVLVVTFFVMGTLVLIYFRGQAIRERQNEIDRYRATVTKLYTRGAVYEERLARKRSREADIASKELLFSTLIEDAQRGIENFSVSDQEELPVVDLGGGLVKRTFEFRLRAVAYDDAIKFLSALESEPQRIVLTEQLKIRSPSPISDTMNFDVTIATWERREVEEKAEEEGKAKPKAAATEDES